MTDDDSSTNASMAAQHSVVPRTKFKVAPTDGSTKFNTIRIPLIPVACWRLNDPAFGFDSSFVSPTFRDEIGTLSGIVAANPECPASLFGHCDPAGGDAINKTLGDRRVIAIYALLTRQPDLWEHLYSDPQVGDRWGTHAIQTMLSSLVDSGGTPYYLGAIDGVAGTGTADAIKQFQGDDEELTANGRLDEPTRKKLFGAYMDWLCTAAPPENGPQAATDAGTPPASTFPMKPTDFLGGAGAKDGDLPKMSLQSCGKFNPTVLLTAAEMNGYDEANRNADDAPNRRVLMFFFAKGTTVDTSVWPCPKVKEVGDACKSAFWPGGDAKRKNGAVKRLYKDTRDTMACRFYDRFARRSPCEGAKLSLPCFVYAKLMDDAVDAPLANTPYVLRGSGGVRIAAVTDANGVLRQDLLPDDTFQIESVGSTELTQVYYLDRDDDLGDQPWVLRMRKRSS